ncbi:hypothetical protein ACFWX2_11450, partial [Amycolatopsis sp. NPDC059020]
VCWGVPLCVSVGRPAPPARARGGRRADPPLPAPPPPHSRVWLRYGDGTRGCAILPAGAVHEHRPGADVVVAWHPEHQAVVPDAGLAGSVAS